MIIYSKLGSAININLFIVFLKFLCRLSCSLNVSVWICSTHKPCCYLSMVHAPIRLTKLQQLEISLVLQEILNLFLSVSDIRCFQCNYIWQVLFQVVGFWIFVDLIVDQVLMTCILVTVVVQPDPSRFLSDVASAARVVLFHVDQFWAETFIS